MTVDVIQFVCPRCKASLLHQIEAYYCQGCDRRYPVVLGIPDFRLFPDPYISIEDDYRKGERLAQHLDSLSFPQVVARYWEMTPGIPADLVREFTRNAVHKREGGLRTRHTIRSIGGPNAGAAVLEIGCATGGFVAAAAPDFTQGIGLDIGFRWLVVAKKRMEELQLDNVVLVCACAEHLPFRDGTFDLVVAEDVLDHTRDQTAFVRESSRVLRQRTGLFHLSTPNRYSLGPDPHVWVWGVGFLPPRWRDAYVRRRKGVPYGPISPVSYRRLRRLLRDAAFTTQRMLLPEFAGLDRSQLSAWHRAGVRTYEVARRLPLTRDLLRLVGPNFHVYCRKDQPVNAPG